jgi:hypothetical protein
MVIKILTFSIARTSIIYPNLDFLFENMPSGNTASLMPTRPINFSVGVPLAWLLFSGRRF